MTLPKRAHARPRRVRSSCAAEGRFTLRCHAARRPRRGDRTRRHGETATFAYLARLPEERSIATTTAVSAEIGADEELLRLLHRS